MVDVLVGCIDLGAGKLNITINAVNLAARLGQDSAHLHQNAQTITAPFQLGKRGIETILVFRMSQQASIFSGSRQVKFNTAPNLPDRDFSVDHPNQQWAGDQLCVDA